MSVAGASRFTNDFDVRRLAGFVVESGADFLRGLLVALVSPVALFLVRLVDEVMLRIEVKGFDKAEHRSYVSVVMSSQSSAYQVNQLSV